MATSRKIPKNDAFSAILFDLDNTLIRTRKGDSLACEKLAECLPELLHIPRERALRACQAYLRAFRLCPDNCEESLDQWRLRLWERALGDALAHRANEVYLLWLELRYRYLALSSDIVALLRQLRNSHLLALVTNGPSAAQWEKVERLGLQRHFDLILVSGDLPWEKPSPEIFRHACRLLNVDSRKCLMVGDKLETDILGGQLARLGATVWVPLTGSASSSKSINPRPDFILGSIHDLPSVVSKRPTPRLRPDEPDLQDTSSNASDGS